jgi:hypothetical protein
MGYFLVVLYYIAMVAQISAFSWIIYILLRDKQLENADKIVSIDQLEQNTSYSSEQSVKNDLEKSGLSKLDTSLEQKLLAPKIYENS